MCTEILLITLLHVARARTRVVARAEAEARAGDGARPQARTRVVARARSQDGWRGRSRGLRDNQS